MPCVPVNEFRQHYRSSKFFIIGYPLQQLQSRQWNHTRASLQWPIPLELDNNICVLFNIGDCAWLDRTLGFVPMFLDVRYMSQATYGNPSNSEEFCCGFHWIAARQAMCIICTMSAECPYNVSGTSVLCLQNAHVLYMDQMYDLHSIPTTICRSCETTMYSRKAEKDTQQCPSCQL